MSYREVADESVHLAVSCERESRSGAGGERQELPASPVAFGSFVTAMAVQTGPGGSLLDGGTTTKG
jgi:hypothetical protein